MLRVSEILEELKLLVKRQPYAQGDVMILHHGHIKTIRTKEFDISACRYPSFSLVVKVRGGDKADPPTRSFIQSSYSRPGEVLGSVRSGGLAAIKCTFFGYREEQAPLDRVCQQSH